MKFCCSQDEDIDHLPQLGLALGLGRLPAGTRNISVPSVTLTIMLPSVSSLYLVTMRRTD